MINFFDLKGRRIEPQAAKKFPVGKSVYRKMKKFNCNIAIPFSSFHQYQRRDSWWANQYTTPVSAYSEGFVEDGVSKIYEPFQRISFSDGEIKFHSIF